MGGGDHPTKDLAVGMQIGSIHILLNEVGGEGSRKQGSSQRPDHEGR